MTINLGKKIWSNRFQLATHLIIWTIWIAISNISILSQDESADFKLYFWDVVLYYASWAFVIYTCGLLIVPLFLNGKKYIHLILASVLLLLIYLLIRYLLDYRFQPILNPTMPSSEFEISDFFITRTVTFLPNYFIGFGYYFFNYSIKKERQLRLKEEETFLLKQEKQEKEQEYLLLHQEKLQLENAFLRSQINPHTLHNILNMLYSKSIKADAPELGDAILLLSNLMRYSLETVTDANGLVPLEKELEQINNTIKINQLRSNNKFHIDFKVTGDARHAKVIPLILITLVENAFKYAELNDASDPLLLHITLDQNSFIFYMHNKKRSPVHYETSHGIGLENTRRRLNAAYGTEGYSIDIKQDDRYYTFQLTIYDLYQNKQIINNSIRRELVTT
jgi:two-component system, LytTR family, sensor kinase